MTDSGYGDPRRGPRRYGPSSAGTPGGPRNAAPPPGGYPGAPDPRGTPRPAGPPRSNPAPGYRPPGRPSGPPPAPTTKFPAAPAGGQPHRPAPPASPYRRPETRRPGPPQGPPQGPPPAGGGSGGDDGLRRTPGWLLAGRIVAIVTAVVLLIGAGIGWLVTGTLQANSGTSDAANNAGSGGVQFVGGMTILLVGSDARTDADGNPLTEEELRQVGTEDDGGGLNTDTIMLVHIPEGGGRATAVSLPRDTWIGPAVTSQIVGPLPDGGEGEYDANKINSFYSTAKAYTEESLAAQGVDGAERERLSNEAGRTMLVRVVQAFTGMEVDHYAEINLLGFYLLSNAIGGVPVCLNAAVNDPWSGANFAAGPQEVQGTAALAFVRQRKGLPGGDLDRVRRQQAFLAGAVDKILSVGTLTNPGKLNELIGAVDRSVIFDKDFAVLTFAEQMVNLSSGNITFETLPTRGAEPSTDKDALATDPTEVRTFFAAIADGNAGDGSGAAPASGGAEVAPEIDPADVVVDVQDGTIADGVTSFAAETVADGGFTLGGLGVVPGTTQGSETASTEIRYLAGEQAAAELVRDAFGLGELIADDAVEAGHVLVVVGTDLQIPGNGLRGSASAFVAPAAARAAAPLAQAPAAASFASSVPCVN